MQGNTSLVEAKKSAKYHLHDRDINAINVYVYSNGVMCIIVQCSW